MEPSLHTFSRLCVLLLTLRLMESMESTLRLQETKLRPGEGTGHGDCDVPGLLLETICLKTNSQTL
jgi:hypothetical protein